MVHFPVLPGGAWLEDRQEGDLKVLWRVSLGDGSPRLKVEAFLGDLLVNLGFQRDGSGAAMGVCVESPSPKYADRTPREKATPQHGDQDQSHERPPDQFDQLQDKDGGQGGGCFLSLLCWIRGGLVILIGHSRRRGWLWRGRGGRG